MSDNNVRRGRQEHRQLPRDGAQTESELRPQRHLTTSCPTKILVKDISIIYIFIDQSYSGAVSLRCSLGDFLDDTTFTNIFKKISNRLIHVILKLTSDLLPGTMSSSDT